MHQYIVQSMQSPIMVRTKRKIIAPLKDRQYTLTLIVVFKVPDEALQKNVDKVETPEQLKFQVSESTYSNFCKCYFINEKDSISVVPFKPQKRFSGKCLTIICFMFHKMLNILVFLSVFRIFGS